MNSSRRKPQNPEVRRILGLPPENEDADDCDTCGGSGEVGIDPADKGAEGGAPMGETCPACKGQG